MKASWNVSHGLSFRDEAALRAMESLCSNAKVTQGKGLPDGAWIADQAYYLADCMEAERLKRMPRVNPGKVSR